VIDYWNDPPWEPEVPECCDEEMQVLDDGSCLCRVCKHRIELQPDPEPMPEPVLADCVPVAVACPHGNLGPCDKCDHLADLAFDAAREQRLCRR
jgi:hypothetical protein